MAAPHKTVTASNEQNGTDQLNKLKNVIYKVHYTMDGRHKKVYSAFKFVFKWIYRLSKRVSCLFGT